MSIHFPALKNVNKPTVWLFPEVLVCLDCGVSEFTVPESELAFLALLECTGQKGASTRVAEESNLNRREPSGPVSISPPSGAE
jgi:hypothetical protein